MDRERLRRQTVLRMRANEAIAAALAAADAGGPSVVLVVDEAIECIGLACGDAALGPGDRLALIDESLLLIALLKEAVAAGQAAGLPLIPEVLRRTRGLLRRYAELVRAAPGPTNVVAG